MIDSTFFFSFLSKIVPIFFFVVLFYIAIFFLLVYLVQLNWVGL
jgi:hypothetical protein